MAEYRNGYKIDSKTGLTEPEARAGLTREQAEASAEADAPASEAAPAQVATDKGEAMADDDLRPDISAARQQMRATVGSGKEVKRLASHLWEGEHVERMAQGQGPDDATAGLLVLTDRRLLYVKEGMFGHKTEDFPLDKISSVDWSSGMATGTLKVSAMGNEKKIKNMNKDDGKEMTDLLRNRTFGAQPVAPAATTAQGGQPAPDIPDQIRKLGELRDAGS